MWPMKGQKDEHIFDVFQEIYDYLRERALSPNLYVMDNECSSAIKNCINKENVNIQRVESHNHWINAAKPAVKAV